MVIARGTHPILGIYAVGTSFQNNMFVIGYGTVLYPQGGDPVEATYNNFSNLIDATFENGQWSYRCWQPKPDGGRSIITATSCDELHTIAKEIITSSPACLEKLEKWRTDAVKRLLKSVPRLKQEYESAANRLTALQAISFKP